jgi:glycosyltransferase involved in cell wall biosynthesis
LKLNYPKLSVVTPSFNQARYLEETIQSVLSQNYPNLEYIIIDGGSTDGSVEIIKKYESNLAYWISEPDHGMYYAVQKGFERCTGEIMAWINSDDKYFPGAFSIVAEIFTRFSKVNWLTGNPAYFDEKGRTIFVNQFRQYSKFDFYSLEIIWIPQESTFWRRNLWEHTGSKLDLQLKYAADSELWLRFFRYEKLYSTKALIGGFRYRSSNQISLNNMKDYILEAKSKIFIEIINKDDKIKLRIYNIVSKIIKLLSKLKIINSVGLRKKIKLLLFNYPPQISFNTISQKFEISE